jgi:hypothetical protein
MLDTRAGGLADLVGGEAKGGIGRVGRVLGEDGDGDAALSRLGVRSELDRGHRDYSG